MKKTICLFGLVFSSFLFVNAQSEVETGNLKKFEVGLNVSNFVKSFASLNTQTVQASPYFVVFKYDEKLRLHFGFKGNNGSDFASSEGSISDNRKLKFDLKAGIEKNKAMGKRWLFHYGIDLVGKYEFEQFTNTANGDEVITSIESAYGGISPFLGLQFKINDRLKLLTEAEWIVATGRSADKLESRDFPEINKKDLSNFTFTELHAPVDLYVIFKF